MEQHTLTLEIQDKIRKVESNARRIKTISTSLIIISILTSATTTFISASTATSGPVVGTWAMSCAISAALAFATTVCVGLNQSLGFNQRILRFNQCAGKLASITISMRDGKTSPDQVYSEYKDIVSNFADEIR